MRCFLCTVILTTFIYTTSATIHVTYLKGVQRFNNSAYIDSYFSCHVVDSMLRWKVNDFSFEAFQGGRLPQVLSYTTLDLNFTYTATLLTSKHIQENQYILDSLLIVSHSGRSDLSVRCTNSVSYKTAASYNNEKSTLLDSNTRNNEIFLEYVLSQNIIKMDASKSVSIFLCGVKNAFLSWQINSIELKIASSDAIGSSQEYLQSKDTALSLQVIRIGGSSMLVTVLILVEDIEHLVTCGFSPKGDQLSSRLYARTAMDRAATMGESSNTCIRESEAEVFLPAILETKLHKEKFKKYLTKLPRSNLVYLVNKVQPGEYFNRIAMKLGDWYLSPYLLKMTYYEVGDIRELHYRDPVSQRQAALATWVQREPNPTYRNLLAVCVVGAFPCATEIINLLSSDKPCTLPSDHLPSANFVQIQITSVVWSLINVSLAMVYVMIKFVVASAGTPFSEQYYSDTITGFPPVEHHSSTFNEAEARRIIPEILKDKKDIEKFKKYVAKIPTNKLVYLDYNIQQGEHFKRIAKDMIGWKSNYYLLKIGWSEKGDIEIAERNPVLQREAALATWMKREPNPTYRNILAISVIGQFPSASIILKLLS